MEITIPIYIEQLPQTDGAPLYSARPLFFQGSEARAEQLSQTLARLAKELRRKLAEDGKAPRHERLSDYSFAPAVEDHLWDFTLDLGDQRAQCRFLIVTFEALQRRIAFTPSLPELWFEIARGETLRERAAEVLTSYFRGRETPRAAPVAKPADVTVKGKAWASTLEIDVQPPQLAVFPQQEFWARLGGGAEKLDGDSELRQVGRCLDWLYPDELQRVVCREREVAELTRLLQAQDRRPLLLSGPRQVGKTALIEEYVFQTVAPRKSPYMDKKNVWLIAPQRLISGMSYVGQWENRLLAIVKEAQKRKHILYFDDLLGLFQAGRSGDSSLSVAQVLKPLLERREIRVLAEITPEAWRVLREVDRGFAEQFQLLPVAEPNEDETYAMLLTLLRQLEQQHRCRFALDALPAAFELQQRYVRDAVFPGKAANFLRKLAVKYRGAEITRREVFAEFHAKSGLAVSFLDDKAKLTREEIITALSSEVLGQPAALAAAADVVCIAKARLNDPARPLAAFLFLGPTGVGKTQCAKTLAAYLFGEAEKLVRFDMNEFVAPGSAARLVGTFAQPEGLLTSAVRRQPFSVILLDEIEKAHHDVFNLLLQVMGEGRLTDALGRTADFTNAIVILTSNLGVKEANSELGFQPQRERESSIYQQAAEKFFSPEFFNRLDRVVPFARLGRDEVRDIARKLLGELFARDGLQRRKCILQVDELALERIVDEGYHPQLGARALKRALERRLTQPVAAQLSALAMTTPTVITLYPGRDGLAVQVEPLNEIAPNAALVSVQRDEAQTLATLTAVIERLDSELAVARPEGAISLAALRPEHYRYFVLNERLQRLQRTCGHLARQAAQRAMRRSSNYPAHRQRTRAKLKRLDNWNYKELGFWQQLFAAQDIESYLQELATDTSPRERELTVGRSGAYELEDVPDTLAEALREAALLDLLTYDFQHAEEERVLLCLRALDRTRPLPRHRLYNWYAGFLINHLGLKTENVIDEQAEWREWLQVMTVRGWRLWPLLEHEEGTHLFTSGHETLAPVQVKLFSLDDDEDSRTVVAEIWRERQNWWAQLAAGAATLDDNPFRLDEVIRIYSERGATVDLRSGLVAQTQQPYELNALMLAALELPEEFS